MELLPGMVKIKTEYRYHPRGRRWAVYKEETCLDKTLSPPGEFTLGTKVAEFATREEARREVYRLNGWKMGDKGCR